MTGDKFWAPSLEQGARHMAKEHDLVQGHGEPSENSVRIADDVVGVIAGIAAMEVEGVAGMSGGFAAEMSERMLGKKILSKGVKAQVGEKEAAIDLYIVVEYGVRIPDVATKVQESVKRSVESMTGLECVEINIHIQGVSFESDNHEDDVRVR
jgi:uncharacterized alkaline shock family protein YloU